MRKSSKNISKSSTTMYKNIHQGQVYLCQTCKAGSTFTNHLGVMQKGGGDTRGYERVIKKSCDGTCKDLPCDDAYRKPHVIKLHTHTQTNACKTDEGGKSCI